MPRDTGLPPETKFYCKDCRKIVEAERSGRKFVYRCAECSTKNVAFGSEKSVRGFYRIKDGDEKKEKTSESL
jgi:DNA-directed RNA polymerase subunit RPC12/RpoP